MRLSNQKTWTWSPLALKFVLFVPPYTYSREVHLTLSCSTTRHSCAAPRLPCFDELAARPDTLEDALKFRLLLPTGSPLTDCWGPFLSEVFSSKCWTVILFLFTWQSGILLLAPRLTLSYLVNHYPFLHFWLMVSGVVAHGSLVPIAQDMWQLSPLLWETWGRLLKNRS